MRDEISRLAQDILVAALASVLGCLVMFLSLTWEPTEVRALPTRWLGGPGAPAYERTTAYVRTLFLSADHQISVANCSSLDLHDQLVPRCPVLHGPWADVDRALLSSGFPDSQTTRLRIGVADSVPLDFVLAVVDHCRGLGFADVELASTASDAR